MPIVTDSGAGTSLDVGTVNDGQFLKRSGSNLIGDTPAAPSVATDPFLAFKPKGIYIPVGVIRDGGPNDDATHGESELNVPTTRFGSWIFAYPEVAPFDATVDRFAMYLSGGGTPRFWIALARETTDANGNSYPGAIVQLSEYVHASGFDGNKLRELTVSPTVSKGERFWMLFQGNDSQPCNGHRDSTCFRNVFGNNTPATFSTSDQRGLIGWTSSAAVTYDATITAFPAGGVMMAMGSKPFLNAGGNTILRPSIYMRYQV